jgi:signal transduction histidine kinase
MSGVPAGRILDQMLAEESAASLLPRWAGAAWVWLPAVVVLLGFGGVAALQQGSGSAPWWWTAAALVCAGAYAVRERWPVLALMLSLLVVAGARLPGSGVLRSGFDVAYLLLLFVPVLPLVATASLLAPRWSGLGLLATVLVTIAVSPDPVWSMTTYSAQGTLVGYVVALGVPTMVALGAWLAGFALRSRQRYAEALLARASSLERTRDAEAARAVAEERARIAQELHDVITHTVAVMVVQASAAGAVWDRSPEQARAALQAVEESGRTAMADLRGMLGAMRADESLDARHAPPGIEALSGLVDAVRTTGVSSRLTVSGPSDDITSVTGLSLLRIAQESVTNALRHAQASTIDIDLDVDAQTVQLSISDNGLGYDATRSSADALDPMRHGGHGVAGMRERAHVIGGTLEIGAPREGGTIVTVYAPLRAGAHT